MSLITVHICMVWPCYGFVDGILINHDCLRILVLLYVMLYIILAYLMLFAALSNAVSLHNAFFYIFFLLLIFENVLCFHNLS